MVKRIFRAIFLTTLAIFLATLFLCLFVFRGTLRSQYQEQLKLRMSLAELAMKEDKDAFFATFENGDENADRITWLAQDGKVLFDSQATADNLENHAEREEIKAASLLGEGQAYRLSNTMRNVTLYYAKKLADGTILRLSMPGLSLWQLFIWLSTPLFFILLMICLISWIWARRLAGRIVKPLAHLDLDSPLKNESYNELSPILQHIDKQQQLLAAKANELNSKDKELAALTHYMSEGMIVLDADGVIRNINREAACYLGVDPPAVCGHRLPDICRQRQWHELLTQVKSTGNAYSEWRHEKRIYSVQAYLLHEYFNEVAPNGSASASKGSASASKGSAPASKGVAAAVNGIEAGMKGAATGQGVTATGQRVADVLKDAEPTVSAVTTTTTRDMDGNNAAHDFDNYKIIVLLFDVTESLLASRQRKEFTANISHELKTPLHSILGSSELLAQGFVPPSEQGQFISMINKEAARLLQLVEDSLRLSQLDEKVSLPFETVNIYLLAQGVLEELQPVAAAKNVSLEIEGTDSQVYGVKRLLQDILFNLLDNAIKYNKTGGKVILTVAEDTSEASSAGDVVSERKRQLKEANLSKSAKELTISKQVELTTSKQRRQQVRLTVKDTGIGIPEEQQMRVFERFYRVQQLDDKINGTGLGLSIVKHAVEYMNGELHLHSIPGQGTSVDVYLPTTRS